MVGRKQHQPTDKTRAEVGALCSFGVKHEDIAAYVGIDAKTLRKHYRAELDVSHIKAHAQVGKFLFNAASGSALANGASYADCLRAAMFYAKTQMRWSETAPQEAEVTDPLNISFEVSDPVKSIKVTKGEQSA